MKALVQMLAHLPLNNATRAHACFAPLLVACLAMGCTTSTLAEVRESESGPSKLRLQMGSRQEELLLAKVVVSNIKRSYRFYSEVVGLKLVELPFPMLDIETIDSTPSPLIEVSMNFTGDAADPFIVLLKKKGAEPVREHARLTYLGLKVSDVESVMKRALAAGSEVEMPIFRSDDYTVGMIRDPDGYIVQLLQVESATRSKE